MARIDRAKAEGVEFAAEVVDKYEDVADAGHELSHVADDWDDETERAAFIAGAIDAFAQWLERETPRDE